MINRATFKVVRYLSVKVPQIAILCLAFQPLEN